MDLYENNIGAKKTDWYKSAKTFAYGQGGLQSFFAALGPISAIVDFGLTFFGNDSAPTVTPINLSGDITLTGTITSESPRDAISFSAFPSYDRVDANKAVQEIPWGIINFYKAGSFNYTYYEPYPEQWPGQYIYSFNGIPLKYDFNPNIPGVSVKSIKYAYQYSPTDDVYYLTPQEFQNYQFSNFYFPSYIMVEVVLSISPTTKNIGQEVKIYRKLPLLDNQGGRIKSENKPLSKATPFPNPAQGIVTVPLQPWALGGNFEVIDSKGIKVWGFSLNSSTLEKPSITWYGKNFNNQLVAEGLYILKVQNQDKVETHKILIKY